MRKRSCSRYGNNTFRRSPSKTQHLSNIGQVVRDDTGYTFLESVPVLSVKRQPGCGVGREGNKHEENRTTRSEGGFKEITSLAYKTTRLSALLTKVVLDSKVKLF
jgi:hypothetical protein